MSAQDRELGHQRYFDLDGLVALIASTGLRIRLVEGVTVKPVTTGQLGALQLPPALHGPKDLASLEIEQPAFQGGDQIDLAVAAEQLGRPRDGGAALAASRQESAHGDE